MNAYSDGSGKALAGMATAKLAAKQFKASIKKTPLQEKADLLSQKAIDDEIKRRANVTKLTGTLFNELIGCIPQVFQPAVEKTVESLAAVQETIDTHKTLVEILVYWENFTSSLNLSLSILLAYVIAKFGFNFVWVAIIIFISNSAFRRL